MTVHTDPEKIQKMMPAPAPLPANQSLQSLQLLQSGPDGASVSSLPISESDDDAQGAYECSCDVIVVASCEYGISEQQNIKNLTNGQRIEEVDEFNYLGTVVICAQYCEKDIQSRIAMGKIPFMDKRHLLKSGLNVDLKKRIIKCFVWSVWHRVLLVYC